MIASWFLASVGIAVLLVGYLRRRRPQRGARPLPGPTGLPYIGPLHAVPSKASWTKLHEWSKKYGPIYEFEVFGTRHVWITEESVAHDLLSKRAPIYSDRPLIPNLPDNRTSGDYLALLGRSDTWKRQRKLCNNMMATSARDSLHSYPTIERDRFLYQMCCDPSSYIEWIEQFTARTVSRLCWGTAQPAQVLRHTTFGLLETISPNGSLPNLINFLQHVPAAISPWKKKEGARHEMEDRLFAANVGFVLDSQAEDRANPSFIGTFYGTKQTQDEEDERYRWGEPKEASNVVGLMAIAGALTIGSPIQSYLLAMCHHPEWQSRVQDEIDSVLEGRCPEWEDRDRLPLLRAVVKEIIRWRPPVPTGIPHASEEDDVYNGFFIPSGTTIHAVEWGITRQEDHYPEPDAFDPGRWLDEASPAYRGPLARHPSLGGFSQFGFGRRTCQGIPIVEQDLFLAMGGMAWAFDVRKARDPATAAERPAHWNDYTPLLIAKPVWFPFDAVPRSADKVDRMRAMHSAVGHKLDAERETGDLDVGPFVKDLGDQIYFEDVAGGESTDWESTDWESTDWESTDEEEMTPTSQSELPQQPDDHLVAWMQWEAARDALPAGVPRNTIPIPIGVWRQMMTMDVEYTNGLPPNMLRWLAENTHAEPPRGLEVIYEEPGEDVEGMDEDSREDVGGMEEEFWEDAGGMEEELWEDAGGMDEESWEYVEGMDVSSWEDVEGMDEESWEDVEGMDEESWEDIELTDAGTTPTSQPTDEPPQEPYSFEGLEEWDAAVDALPEGVSRRSIPLPIGICRDISRIVLRDRFDEEEFRREYYEAMAPERLAERTLDNAFPPGQAFFDFSPPELPPLDSSLRVPDLTRFDRWPPGLTLFDAFIGVLPPELTHFDGPPSEQTHFDSSLPEQTHFDSSLPEQTHFDSSPPEQPLVDSAPSEQTLVDSAPPEQPLVDSAPPERTLVDSSPPERTLVDSSLPEQTHFDSSLPEQTHFDGSPSEQTLVDSSPPERTLFDGFPREETLELGEGPHWLSFLLEPFTWRFWREFLRLPGRTDEELGLLEYVP